MIVLTVLSYYGAPTEALSASFDELGGSIGRAENNQLVLPDPERSVSRVHAKLVFRGGSYAIVDNGSNPITVNGKPVCTGREQALSAGDELSIGGYRLSVTQAAQAGTAADDPFADLFGDTAFGLAGPSAAPAALMSRAPAASWPAPPPLSRPSPASSMPPRAPSAGLSPGQIPDDWNPFAPEASAPVPPAPAAQGSGALGLSLGSGLDDSLDDLFGLGASPMGGDPLGAAPRQALLMQPNMAAHADPLQSLGRSPDLSAPSLADHGSELNTPMPLPPSARVSAAAPAAPAAWPEVRPTMPTSPTSQAGPPPGAIFSWDEPLGDGRSVAPPGQRQAVPSVPPLPSQAAPQAASQAAPHVAPQPASAAHQPAADDQALLAALLAGLATPGLRIDALTPELMLLTGQLLRESMRGAVELLLARSALKREMRADMTMIVARENNPLKFSPSVEVALQHLLAPPSPGFMAPAPAVRDAFNDLRAHQLGVMAGMKSALQGVLQRFDPQQLEAKLTQRGGISSLIPGQRKARLWEAFQQLFEQLSGEAQDDFDDLFGKAFLQAYEAQLDRLHDEPGPR